MFGENTSNPGFPFRQMHNNSLSQLLISDWLVEPSKRAHANSHRNQSTQLSKLWTRPLANERVRANPAPSCQFTNSVR